MTAQLSCKEPLH